MAEMEDKFRILKHAIETVSDKYEYIIIDSPPSLSLLTVNGMIAADYLLLPVQTEFYALEGVAQLLDRPFDADGSECVHPVFANGDIVLHEIGHLTNRLKSSSLYAVMLNCWFWRPLVWANSNFSMAM